ncbi:PTS lactose/cellobiose transporter subunit IIA [Paraliobacillus sediminis]|uniref:PTS lactose/cellobiose transporter subunit IIA n=1 Tax=Paraliobacillus sediminis TaxID=1885916 RepID=UPI0019682C83|nr:PTS lactose/cellobiose transporter subunit IIA [Paraliobacillus sediminis]
MGIIVNGGNARSNAMRAIAASKQGNIEEANQFMELASEDLNKAHRIQTDLIQAEARGDKAEISLLMIHAQDHLMNAMTVKDLAVEMIHMHEKISNL